MRHLKPDEIIDVVEGCAGPRLAAHARECAACRPLVESAADALRQARSDPSTEPSPLFWPHLAARIGEAVRREGERKPVWRAWGRRLAPVGAVAALVIAVAIGTRLGPAAPVNAPPAPAFATRAPALDAPAAEGSPADDPSWMLVSALSADVNVEDAEASGALPLPGAAERALFDLDGAERLELARLIREEMEAGTPAVLQGPGA